MLYWKPRRLLSGDNLIEGGIKGFVEEFNSFHPDALILLKEVHEPRLFGVAELDASGRVMHLVEKPILKKSGDQYVSLCLELTVVGCGATKGEAISIKFDPKSCEPTTVRAFAKV